MANFSQVKFGYTDAELDALDSTLSKDRLYRYLRLGNGDRRKAIRFYEMNNVVSESFFGVIRGLEITLRNSVHFVMTAATGKDDWYHRLSFLGPWEKHSIEKAEEAIRKNHKTVIPSRVISELTMGFWCGLTSKMYDADLWVPHLHKAFPRVKIGRKKAHGRLEHIRKMRNRIAHHECILDHHLTEEYKDVIDAIAWICPTTAAWVHTSSTFHFRLQELANLIASPVTVTVIGALPVAK